MQVSYFNVLSPQNIILLLISWVILVPSSANANTLPNAHSSSSQVFSFSLPLPWEVYDQKEQQTVGGLLRCHLRYWGLIWKQELCPWLNRNMPGSMKIAKPYSWCMNYLHVSCPSSRPRSSVKARTNHPLMAPSMVLPFEHSHHNPGFPSAAHCITSCSTLTD